MITEGFIPAETFADILSNWFETDVQVQDIKLDELADGYVVQLIVDDDNPNGEIFS